MFPTSTARYQSYCGKENTMTNDLNFSPLPTLETKRLILRPLAISDAETIFEYSKSPAFCHCLKRKTPFSFEEVQKFISGILKKDPSLYWAVILKENNRLIGDCGLCELNQDAQRAELSYAISPDAWNQGYATEAVDHVIRYGFEQNNLNRIEAHCNTGNAASEKVLQNNGLTLEGILRQYIQCDGQPLDMKMYSILKQEWLGRQAAL
jgi:ribosomal-protein-alanine N-acetyltransferase